MDKAVVAAAQLGPASPDEAKTVARIVGLIEQAAQSGAKLVCFPEMALTPYFAARMLSDDELASYFHPAPPNDVMAPILDAARSAGMVLVIGFAEEAETGRYNSAAVIDADGTVCGLYRKVHIPGTSEPDGDGPQQLERRYYRDGDLGFPVYDTAIGRVGVLICADRGFPEAWRVLGLRGADIVCTPTNTSVLVPNRTQTGEDGDPAVELRAMKTLQMAASASFNHYYVVGAGKSGTEWGIRYVGGSTIISPWGHQMESAVEDEDVLVMAEIDPSAPARLREKRNLFTRRRIEHYAPIMEPMGEDVR